MFPRADIAGTRPVASVEATKPTALVADTRQEIQHRLNQFAVGKMFQAEVLSRLNDGTVAVRIADVAVHLNLPTEAHAGEVLDLKLIATQPRLTFSIEAPKAEADAAISDTGRLIDNLLRAAQKQGASTALVGKVPLVPSPSAGSTQVATALKDALVSSGLFYESHVAQWINGERSLTDLLREPQAKNSNTALLAALLSPGRAAPGTGALPATPGLQLGMQAPETYRATPNQQLPSNDPAAAGTGPIGDPTPGNAPPPGAAEDGAPAASGSAAQTGVSGSLPTDESAIAKPALRALSLDTLSAIGLTADSDMAPPPKTIGNDAVQMINLQLTTLEQQRVVWQGELWPGQPMEWEVHEDRSNGHSHDAERSWQSTVRFELPTLGAVSATIQLTGERVQVQVRTADEPTASLLRRHGDELASALAATGSPLDLLTVKRDDAA